MATVFTQIINGALPGHFVWQDDRCVVILTIQPLRDGHLLVIPREEVDCWDDLPAPLAAHLISVSQSIAKAIKAVFAAPRAGIVVAGFEVPHTHLHVFPAHSMEDFDFSRAAAASAEQLADNAAKIRAQLQAQGFTQADC